MGEKWAVSVQWDCNNFLAGGLLSRERKVSDALVGWPVRQQLQRMDMDEDGDDEKTTRHLRNVLTYSPTCRHLRLWARS